MDNELLPVHDLIKDLSVLHLEPGDVVLARTIDIISTEAKAQIYRILQSAFPLNKTIVVDNVLEIGVVRVSELREKINV